MRVAVSRLLQVLAIICSRFPLQLSREFGKIISISNAGQSKNVSYAPLAPLADNRVLIMLYQNVWREILNVYYDIGSTLQDYERRKVKYVPILIVQYLRHCASFAGK